jgi:tetratricopeptide (TPR) repeat protein
VKFIFTTRNEELMPQYFHIKTKKLGVGDLKIIFKNNYFKNENEVLKADEEENLEKTITEIYKFNTKLIVLGATSCKHSHININKFYKILANDKFAKELEEKFKTDEDLDEKQMCQHVLKLFSISGIKRKLKKILTYMSLIDYGGVKIELFKKWLKLENFDLLNELAARGWVEFDKDDNEDITVLMHPVISDAVFEQTKPNSEKCKKFLDNILAGVNEQTAYKYLHLTKILEFIIGRFDNEETEEVGFICNQTGYLCDTQGEYDKSLDYHFRALEIREKVFGEYHPDTVNSYNNIGIVYDKKGDYEKALEIYDKSQYVIIGIT